VRTVGCDQESTEVVWPAGGGVTHLLRARQDVDWPAFSAFPISHLDNQVAKRISLDGGDHERLQHNAGTTPVAVQNAMMSA